MFIKEGGKEARNLAMELKLLLMGLFIREILIQIQRMEKENCNCLMGVHMRANLLTIKWKEMAYINESIKANILDNLKIINWMVKESLFSLMEKFIKEVFKRIKSMGQEK